MKGASSNNLLIFGSELGTVEEYVQNFERLTAQVRKLPDDQYKGYFLHGLKSEIWGRVRSLIALGPLSRSISERHQSRREGDTGTRRWVRVLEGHDDQRWVRVGSG